MSTPNNRHSVSPSPFNGLDADGISICETCSYNGSNSDTRETDRASIGSSNNSSADSDVNSLQNHAELPTDLILPVAELLVGALTPTHYDQLPPPAREILSETENVAIEQPTQNQVENTLVNPPTTPRQPSNIQCHRRLIIKAVIVVIVILMIFEFSFFFAINIFVIEKFDEVNTEYEYYMTHREFSVQIKWC